MDDKPPDFDTVKWSFFLVAGVLVVHCIVVLAGVVFCWSHEEAAAAGRCHELRGSLTETLAAALAAALAFAGGFSRREK